MKENNKTALIVGATGLVGGHLVNKLLHSKAYEKVISISRSSLNLNNEKLEEILMSLDQLEELKLDTKIDVIFCCLGTTIKKAGSKENFRKVDFDYVIAAAALGLKHNAHQFSVVSAVGADASSSFFYNRVKGDVEEALKNMEYKSLHIYRPSILGGDREEFRFGEKVASWFMRIFKFLFLGKLKRYAIVEANDVAARMLENAQDDKSGVYIHESETLHN